MFIVTKATGKYELSFENPYELLRTYINWFGMSTNTKKGQFNLNYPLIDVASKMPLIFSPLLPTKAKHNSRKNARTSQKSPNKIMQCFKSARVYGAFFYKYQKGSLFELPSSRLVEGLVAQSALP
jgi:hypothetical protein